MSFNHVENAFLATAIDNLKLQWEKHYGQFPGLFYLGNGVKFMVIGEGEDKGKLTVAQRTIDDKFIPDPDIILIDCYNLIKPGEDLATAVARVYLGRPTTYSIMSENCRTNGNTSEQH